MTEEEQPDRRRTQRRAETDPTTAQHVADEQPDADGEQQAGDQSAGQHADETFGERRLDVDPRVAVELECDQQRVEVRGDPIGVAALRRLRDVHGEQLPPADEPVDDDRRIDHGLGDDRITTAFARGGPEHGADRGDRLLVRRRAVPLDRCRRSDDRARCEPQLLGRDRDECAGAEGVAVDERDRRDTAPEQHVAHPQHGVEAPAGRVDAHDERGSVRGLGLAHGALEQRGDTQVDLAVDDDDVHGRHALGALRAGCPRGDDQAERSEAEQQPGHHTARDTGSGTVLVCSSRHARRVRGRRDAGAGRG